MWGLHMQRRFAFIVIGSCIYALVSGIPLLYAAIETQVFVTVEIAVLAWAICAIGFTLFGISPRFGRTKLLDAVGVVLIASSIVFSWASIYVAVVS